MFGDNELPLPPRFSQAPLACTGKVCPKSAASGRVALQPGGPMLAYVPVAFDVYRPLKPRHRWAMQCLVSFADHSGRCFPSIRAFAAQAGISKSVAQRDLAACAAAGYFTRERRPGGVYVYQIAERFLPRWPVSQKRSSATQGGVPPRGSTSVPVSA